MYVMRVFIMKSKKKLIGIITKGDIVKAYNRKRFMRKQMSWQEESQGNKLLIDYYKCLMMSSGSNRSEIRVDGARSNGRAKSSPSLVSLFEKMMTLLKKYW